MQQLREDIHYLKEAVVNIGTSQKKIEENQTKLYKLLMGGVNPDGQPSEGLVQQHQRVEALLFGDHDADNKGLARRMNELEIAVENKKLKWRWLAGWAAGAGATVTAFIEWLRNNEVHK